MSLKTYEQLLSRHPFVVQKRVRWADCDPAGVVYTGKFTEYLLLAVSYFFDEIGGGHYAQWLRGLGVDTPCKGMDLVFHAALWPEDVFEMHGHVGEVRAHSYDFHVEAQKNNGQAIFSGRFSPICIGRDVRQRVDIPAPMRDALSAWQKA